MPADNALPIDKLFSHMVKVQASDLHLKADSPPLFRIDGALRSKGASLSAEQVDNLVRGWLSEQSLEKLFERGNVDLAHEFGDGRRVRVAAFLQRGRISLVARLVNAQIPSLEELHLPDNINDAAELREGLVLVCGITGAGKSTTLAYLIDKICRERPHHIITFEDPIEYVFEDRKGIINQREYGLDFHDWMQAISSGVRSDPDIMLIGEMRDRDTFQLALTAAETGHLVLSTMHTSGAAGTIGRILDLFPREQHGQIRRLLAMNLKGIISQRLVPSFHSDISRVPAIELMWMNAPLQKAIEEGEDGKIGDLIKTGEEEGMQTWTTSLVNLIRADLVEKSVAREYAPNAQGLETALKGISF